MDPNEKIQLDDISFDEGIAGDGVATETVEPVEETKEEQQPVENTE